MRLIGVVHMVAVHALLLGIALFKELGCHLREHCVGQHILFLRCPLGSFCLQLVHLRSQSISKAAGNGLLVAQDLLGELGLDGSGSLAVITVDQTLELLGDHLVALAQDHIEHSLRTNDLAGGGDQRRIACILADAGDLCQHFVQLIFLAGILQLFEHVGEHAARHLIQQGVCIHAEALRADLAVGNVLLAQLCKVCAHNVQLLQIQTGVVIGALQGTDYDTGLDLKQLNVVRAYFAKLREKYIANGQISPKSLGVDANTLLYQVPGGMFSNMLKQLKDAGKEDKLDEVLAEIPRVREDAGYPPLVTPTSQIVGTQAVFNVILGERYKMVTKEFKGLVHGDYGKTPAPIKPEFTKKILGDEQPITCRFADTLAPEMDKLKAEAAKWATQEEDVLTYAMFPQVAPKFFEKRNAKKQGVDGDHVDYTNQSHPV